MTLEGILALLYIPCLSIDRIVVCHHSVIPVVSTVSVVIEEVPDFSVKRNGYDILRALIDSSVVVSLGVVLTHESDVHMLMGF